MLNKQDGYGRVDLVNYLLTVRDKRSRATLKMSGSEAGVTFADKIQRCNRRYGFYFKREAVSSLFVV